MLTDEQVIEAVRQMISHTKLLMEQYHQGTGSYDPVSARGVLYTLGFEETDADQVLRAVASTGFWYCLDPVVPDERDGHRFSRDACYWGPDQLESRLDGIPWRLEAEARS